MGRIKLTGRKKEKEREGVRDGRKINHTLVFV